ncbi:molybdopterin-dependent oxidoreductase [Mycolicibacterium palauense]|uniref:molybdopterin-dependent oxidoreductase n=1 Tax=Mycolicibacterium palauense TaxID=2034511 RepID=UPI000BFEE297|nr:molybdopterin cofactor-binding domain-containing protein [Mycolicibacterium palauense]
MKITVDGVAVPVTGEEFARPLVETLREAGTTAVKMPCGEGSCGGCTILLDGAPALACVTPTARAVGRDVQSATGAVRTRSGAGLRTELARRGALQCGFCVPGVVCSAVALLERGSAGVPIDASEVRRALSGHLCRCTGYEGLVDAVLRVAAGADGNASTRVDGPEKVAGTQRFAADHAAGGAYTGLLLTSRSSHARVTVHPGTALDVPGAVAVLGPQDSPPGRFGSNPHIEDPVLGPAENAVFTAEARYQGDIVGMVVAETPQAAREMAARVDQHETQLAAVHTLAEALAIDAPLARSGDPDNIAVQLAFGATEQEVHAALDAAARTFTHSVRILPGPVAAMERPAAVATWHDGRCRVWSTSQTPQVVRRRLATLLEIDLEDVDLEAVALGGGFGLKEEMFLEPAAAVASRAVGGHPVRVELTRAQLGRSRRRHGGTVTITSGTTVDGTILVRDVRVDLDAGGEVSHSGLVLENLLLLAMSLYPVAVSRAAGRAVLTNVANSGAFRGYGSAELSFAMEGHMDELCRAFGVDPVVYRRRHVLRPGQTDPVNGWSVRSFASEACLDALAEAGRVAPAPPRDRSGRWLPGRGLALFAIVSAASSAVHQDIAGARCRLDEHGPVVGTVVPDMGQGLHSMLASVAAGLFGAEPDDIRVEQLSSAHGPDDEGTFASRGVYMTGNAVVDAIDELAVQVEHKLGWPAGQLRWTPSGPCRDGEQPVGWHELTGLSADGQALGSDNGLVIGGQLVDVAVDTYTGRVLVERVTSVHDVGRVIDPDSARGQVVGGVVQGTGVALTEQARHLEGHAVDVHLFDHAIPTMLTEIDIRDVYVTDGRARGKLGAKGLGEAPMVGIPAAVANAIRDATGVRPTAMPMTPERVHDALRVAGISRIL